MNIWHMISLGITMKITDEHNLFEKKKKYLCVANFVATN